jgi:hypothetical protein
MNATTEQYTSQQADITTRAEEMKKTLLYPVLADSGKFVTESSARAQAIDAAVPGSIFENGGKAGGFIAGTSANALRNFCTTRGIMPADDLLAAAHRSIETLLGFAAGKSEGNLILESATLNTTEGIQFRDRMVALILPVMLQTISSQMVGFLPGNFNRSEIFRLYRTAGTTFGDITAGDRIDQHYKGQYGTMDQRYLSGTGDAAKDGVAHEFKLDSNVKFGKVYPMKKTSVRILHDRNVVAADDGKGNVTGTFKVGATTVNVTGTVNYVTGVVDPVFSVAPAVGIEIHTAFDVDIEKAPSLIPTVNHELDNRVLIPHEAAIAAETTLQALWYLRREMNINSDSMAMMAMRNLLAADKDRKALAEMMFFAKGSYTWNYTLPSGGISPADYFDTLLPVLLQMNSEMLNRTQISGLVGIVADTASSSKLMSSTRAGQFTPAPGYQPSPQPHYAGRLFGMFDLYINPQAPDFKCLGFGKGTQISHCGYMAGDAIPAMAFKHAVQQDLNYRNTLWELAYRDLQPFDGRDYLTVLNLEP